MVNRLFSENMNISRPDHREDILGKKEKVHARAVRGKKQCFSKEFDRGKDMRIR